MTTILTLRAGYTHKLGEKGNETYYIQPQAQLIYMGVHSDNYRDKNNTDIRSSKDNFQTRLGVKALINGFNERIDSGKNRVFQPFVELNWIYNHKDFDAHFNGVQIKQKGTKNIGEVKLGVEGKWDQRFHLWGNVAQQVGGKGYSDSQAMVGVKYHF